jgi:hypothetical protein
MGSNPVKISAADISSAPISPPGFELTASQKRKLEGVKNVRQLFQRFFFKGVVLDSHEGMVAWLENRYPLELREDIPEPLEMLEAQCNGFRFVTLIEAPDRQLLRYGRHQDACAFTLHDLEHAHKFFADPENCRGQIRFFKGLKKLLTDLDIWKSDDEFQRDLHYLMSDMNSHPVHLVKFFKAIVLGAEVRRKGQSRPDVLPIFKDLFSVWSMPSQILNSALNINQPEAETLEDQRLVADFFMNPRSQEVQYV